jgi:hypothetical protein
MINKLHIFLKNSPSGMLRSVALVRTDVSEEHRASIIRVTRIGEVGTLLAVNTNRRTLRRNIFLSKCYNAMYTIHIRDSETERF